MNSRAKGRRNENKTKDALEAEGWLIELVKGGTGWQRSTDFFGLFDIIAVKGGRIRWLQIKSNRNASPKDRAAMADFPGPGTREVWVWYDRKPKPIIHKL